MFGLRYRYLYIVMNDPKNFKIPSAITLFGHRYLVVLQDDLFEKESCYGYTDDDLKKIVIQTPRKVTKEYILTTTKKSEEMEVTHAVFIETFYHELTHAIFDALGEEKLSKNEALVNMFGKAMLEVYLSSEYEETSKSAQ